MVFSASRVQVGRTNKTHRDNQLRRILGFGEQQAEALGIGFQQLEETQTGIPSQIQLQIFLMESNIEQSSRVPSVKMNHDVMEIEIEEKKKC